jgi:hypothetical protein
MSSMASGSRVTLLFEMARNLSDDKRLMSSGMLVIEFLLRSRISRFESWRIYSQSDLTVVHLHIRINSPPSGTERARSIVC